MLYRADQHDTGVSSVVGVILMVALTVILAAVLGQFVFDLANILHPPIQAGATFQEDMSDTTTDPCDPYGGEPCYDVVVIASNLSNADYIEIRGGDPDRVQLDEVGDSQTLYDQPEGELLTVVGYQDGRSSVIQTYTIGSSSGAD